MTAENVFTDLFGGLFGLPALGSYPEPPDSLVLRILGLDARPASQDVVRSAFRARLRQVHPDLTESTYSAVPSLQSAAGALAMQRPEVAELAWARDVLLRKIPPPAPVTAAASSRAGADQPSRWRCRECGQSPARGSQAITAGRWAGYCRNCAAAAGNARHRRQRLTRRRNRTCQFCGELFTPPRSDGLYCSPACRQKAYRHRAAEVSR
ncbi:MAG: hypothetical protein ACRDOK_01540 [Streptosporangiaceae bacterium]